MASRPQLFSSLASRPQQPRDAYFLRMLPSVMVVDIARGLCRLDQYNLMQVSVAFRICLEEEFNKRTLTKISSEQQLEYLLARALTLPGHWACEECIDMHEVDLHDFPSHAKGCPISFRGVVQDALSPPSAYISAKYNLKHHHIQLALKYHRLSGPLGLYRNRLRRLFTKYIYIPDLRFANYPNFRFHAFGVGKYSYEPRVSHGRFLLSTKLDFVAYGRNLSHDGTPGLYMCHHQEWFPSKLRALRHFQMLVTLNSPLTYEQTTQYRYLRWLASNVLWRAMAVLVSQKLAVLNVSCPFCPTDMRVTRSATVDGKVHYQAISWHDFGIEGTLPDPRWRTKHYGRVMTDLTCFRHNPPPGRVRQLWEESQAWCLPA